MLCPRTLCCSCRARPLQTMVISPTSTIGRLDWKSVTAGRTLTHWLCSYRQGCVCCIPFMALITEGSFPSVQGELLGQLGAGPAVPWEHLFLGQLQ